MASLDKEPTVPKDSFDKKKTEAETDGFKDQLFDLQNTLFAEKKHSLLVILAGLDASGKDGTVSHVFSSMNPMGVNVKAFKAPTEEEQEHDFLWRVHPHVPAKGMIQIFNRSHYEDILVPTVHKTFDKDIIERRYDIINAFEQSLVDEGTVILKFFLNVSKEEQKERIKDRLTVARKKWKYDPADKTESEFRDDYLKVYDKIFERCSPKLPWIIVPADKKWYRNYIVAKTMVDTLKALKMKYPS
ncbi:MAG TPA: PPK2 family polyphosphate kinase [Bacteroidia bacterium]|jgi:PPK2 family polyphosphate:nucleotide phosphotransferase|nr:PPK2 family polyphosphate kinase [Bacteroidia bacterium]